MLLLSAFPDLPVFFCIPVPLCGNTQHGGCPPGDLISSTKDLYHFRSLQPPLLPGSFRHFIPHYRNVARAPADCNPSPSSVTPTIHPGRNLDRFRCRNVSG